MKTLSIRVAPSVHQKLNLLAQDHNKNTSQIVRELIVSSLDKQPSEIHFEKQARQLTQIAVSSSEILDLLRGLITGLAEMSERGELS